MFSTVFLNKKKEGDMPNYGGFNPEETELYRRRYPDEAHKLYAAIKAADPEMKGAFTPEKAEKLFAKKNRKKSQK